MLLAQVVAPEPWVQLVIQVGSLGLLAYIVIVLAPTAIREARAEREAREKLFAELTHLQQAKFDDRSGAIEAAVQGNTATISKAIAQQTKDINGKLGSICKAAGHS